ncbi:hypothetical protein [Sphingobium sp. B8D3D]|nr:hypothetical protein [Sphingobium sp. B8D3D]MCW2414397.1 hypothetical protein [Sphingobium sp. B8D3A]
MTINERLFVSRLIDAFDEAAKSKDRRKMIELLTDIAVEDAVASADAILGIPNR